MTVQIDIGTIVEVNSLRSESEYECLLSLLQQIAKVILWAKHNSFFYPILSVSFYWLHDFWLLYYSIADLLTLIVEIKTSYFHT